MQAGTESETPTSPAPGEPGYIHERPPIEPDASQPDILVRLSEWTQAHGRDQADAARLLAEASATIAYLRAANQRLVGQERTIRNTFDRVKDELAALDVALAR